MDSKDVCREIADAVNKYSDVSFDCEDCGVCVRCVTDIDDVFFLSLIYDFCQSGDFVSVFFEFDTKDSKDVSKLKLLSQEYNDIALYSEFENAGPCEIYGGGWLKSEPDVKKTTVLLLDELIGDGLAAGIIRKMVEATKLGKTA